MLAFYLAICSSDEQRRKIEFIYENYYKHMFRAVYLKIGNKDIAGDIVHDTMVKLINRHEIIPERKGVPLVTYVVTAAWNTAEDYDRRVKSRQKHMTEEPAACDCNDDNCDTIDNILINQETYRKLVDCIRKLPITYKDVCYCKYVCDMSEQDIANKYDLTYSNVAKRISRGKRILRKRMAEVMEVGK